ncbi:MAG: dTDP-4-amino-4,6-dideoxygalactose transaminase [Psychroserpens sp.]|jgi:dTDP-4-amino-4,6-dideoxygalactose transaminase
MKVRLSKCSISEAEVNEVKNTLLDEYLGMGSKVAAFEHDIKHYLGTELDVVCVNSGTSALNLALASLDIGVGDEVLVPSLTYIASFQAISATGARPVACEVIPSTLFLCPIDAENKITNKTKAIMPVHYASSPKGREAIYDLAKKYSLRVVEDAAQSFGSLHNGLKVGTHGDVICFSFDGIKNITAAEGGAVLTADKKLAERLRDGRLLGVEKDTEMRFAGKRSWDFDVNHQGFRFHMSNVNAAIGIQQLKRIEDFKVRRQRIAHAYKAALNSINAISLLDVNFSEIMPHIFVITAARRDQLRQYLLDANIECGLHYKPNHLLSLYKTEVTLPLTEGLYGRLLTLPCHVDLSEEEQNYVIDKIRDFYNA